LDGFGETPLMRRADAGDAARRDLAALGNKGRKQPHVLVVDIVDLLHAETAHLLAPEVLLAGRDGFVAAGGALRSADGTSAFLLFSHGDPPLLLTRPWSRRSTGSGSSGRWTVSRGRRGYGRAGNRRSRLGGNSGSGRRRRRLASRALLARFPPLLHLLHLFVDAHRDELHHRVRHAKTALDLPHHIGA